MTPNDVIVQAKKLLQDNQLLRTTPTYSTETLLGFVNQSIKRMSLLRPDLFTVVAPVSLTPNTVIQSLPANAIRFVEAFSYGYVNGDDIPWSNIAIDWEDYTTTWNASNSWETLTALWESDTDNWNSPYAWESITTLWENDTDKWDIIDGIAIEEVTWERMSRTDKNWTTAAAAVPIKFMRNKYNALRFFVYPRPTLGSYLLAEYAIIPDTYDLDSTIDVLQDGYLTVLVDGVLAYVYGIDGVLNDKGDPRSDDCVRSFYKALGLEPVYDNVPDDFLSTALKDGLGMGALGAGEVPPPPPPPPVISVFFDPQTSHPSLAFSNDNLTVATTLSYNPSGGYGAIANTSKNSGKYYVEFTVNAYNTAGVIVPPSTAILNAFAFGFATGPNYIGIPTAIAVGANANSWGVSNTAYTGNLFPVQNVPAFSPWALWHSYPATGETHLSVSELPISGTVVGMAVDFDAGKIWFSVDGLWIDRGTGAGDPVTGINPAFTFTPNTSLYPAATLNYDTTITGNFGATVFTYLMPSGFVSWEGTAIPQPSPQQPVEVVVNINTSNSVNVVVTDTATLTAGVTITPPTPVVSSLMRYGTNTAPLVLLGSSKAYFEVELIGTSGVHVGVTGLFGGGSFVAIRSFTTATDGFNSIILLSSAFPAVQLSLNALQIGQTVAVAIDTVSNKVWLAIDNVWVQSGNPSAGTNPTFVSSSTTPYYPDVRMYCAAANLNTALTKSKFKTSALKYAPPTGFVALQTALNS